jgi:PASTA domain
MLAAGSSPPATLTWNQTIVVLVITAVVLLLAGLVVILGRKIIQGADPDQSIVRSWLALALVAGLILFCAVTFAISNQSLQSTLFGALTASTGAAVAFYFSSKNADNARQDILNATFGTDSVPNLHGLTKDEATTALGSTAFKLEIDPASSPAATATVSTQKPEANSPARKGSTIVVTLT